MPRITIVFAVLIACAVLSASAAPTRLARGRAHIVKDGFHKVEDAITTQITVEASPTTAFLGLPYNIGIDFHQAVPAGMTLTLTATGSDGSAVVANLDAGESTSTITIVPNLVAASDLGTHIGVYNLDFSVSGPAAGNYRKPPSVTLPVVEQAQGALPVGGFEFIHVNESISVPVYLAVPVPYSLGPVSLVVSTTDGFYSTLTFQPGQYYFQNLTYTASNNPGTYTMSFAFQGEAAKYYVAPPSFDFVILGSVTALPPSEISLLGLQATYASQTMDRITALLSSPVPTGTTLELYVQSDNGFLDTIIFHSGEVAKAFTFECGNTPGDYTLFFFVNLNAAPYYQAPPPSPFRCSPPVAQQIAATSTPITLIAGSSIGVEVTLPQPLLAGQSLSVVGTDSEGQKYTATFSRGVNSQTVSVSPKNAGTYTITWAVEGSAAAQYLPPPKMAWAVVQTAMIVVRNLTTVLTTDSASAGTFFLEAPVPAGLTLEVSIKTTSGVVHPVTVISDSVTISAPISYSAGKIMGTFDATFVIGGTAAKFFKAPPAFGYAVISATAVAFAEDL